MPVLIYVLCLVATTGSMHSSIQRYPAWKHILWLMCIIRSHDYRIWW